MRKNAKELSDEDKAEFHAKYTAKMMVEQQNQTIIANLEQQKLIKQQNQITAARLAYEERQNQIATAKSAAEQQKQKQIAVAQIAVAQIAVAKFDAVNRDKALYSKTEEYKAAWNKRGIIQFKNERIAILCRQIGQQVQFITAFDDVTKEGYELKAIDGGKEGNSDNFSGGASSYYYFQKMV